MASKGKSRVKKVWHATKKVFIDYAKHSTIHGVSYITEPGRSLFERGWWICVLSISVLICGKLLYDATNIDPIIISFMDEPTPIWQVPFPAVTLCPKSVASWNLTKIDDLGEEYFESLSETDKLQTLAKNTFCHVKYLESVKGYTDCNDCLETMRKMKIPPEEMFVECKFQNKFINCTEVFKEIIVDSQICYTFNGVGLYRQSTDDKNVEYQAKGTRRTFSAGPQYGFSVLLRSHKKYYDVFCTEFNGFYLEYRQPHETPQFKTNFVALRMENSLNLVINPKMVVTADDLRGYSLQDRHCYFENERRLEYFRQYAQSNCEIECEIIEIVKQCNRIPIIIEYRRGMDVVGPNQYDCVQSAISSVRDQNYQKCNCLPTCTEITFDAEMQMARFNTSTDDQVTFSRLNIYFKDNQFMALQRTELYGKTDFLANCGGLLGLCLGVSMLSIVELIYFCSVRLWIVVRGSRKEVEVETVFVESFSSGIPKTRRLLDLIKTLFEDYIAKTTLQGVKYMGERNSSRMERYWWTFVVVISILCCGSLIYKVLRRYDQTPVIISYANEATSISDVPFPSVTICSKIFAFPVVDAYNYFNVRNRSLYNLPQFMIDGMPLAAHICDPSLFSHVDPENRTDCEKCVEILTKFSGEIDGFCTSSSHIIEFQACSELFKPIVTERGLCYAYNALQIHRDFSFNMSKDITDNWTIDNGYRNNTGNVDIYPRAGSKISLRATFAIYKAAEHNFCQGSIQGLKVYLHMPNESPQVSKHFYLLPYRHLTQILIKPRMTISAPEIRDLPIDKRQCYFSEERYLRFYRHYTQNNCEIECVANLTLSRCKCLGFHMPKVPGVKLCGISDIMCQQTTSEHLVEQNINQQQDGCDCLPTCTSIAYDTELNHVDFSEESSDIVLESPGFAEKYYVSFLVVVFKENQFVAQKRSLLFGKTEILANCGGLLGLFLGFSFISILELFYFCCLRFLCGLKL